MSDGYDPQDKIDQQFEAFRLWAISKVKDAGLLDIFGTLTGAALVILGIIGAFIYGGQLAAMLDANSLAHQSVHGSQRAWIGVEQVTEGGFYPKGSYADGAEGYTFSVTFKLKNYGHSPAQHVRLFPDLDGIGALGHGECNDANIGAYVGDIIFPEQDRTFPFGPRITTKQIESALKQQNPVLGSKLFLILHGCIEYIDDPSETTPHHTPFSYFITKTGGDHLLPMDLNSVPAKDIDMEPNLGGNIGRID